VDEQIEKANRPTVLIVDRDLGFVFWLGQGLDAAGYLALPAKSCEDASDLLNQLNIAIDLLILGNSCAGANVFCETLRHSQRCLKVIVAVSDWERPSPPFPRADAARHKTTCWDEISKLEWLETIEAVLSPGCATN
jgi:hypothetical protein